MRICPTSHLWLWVKELRAIQWGLTPNWVAASFGPTLTGQLYCTYILKSTFHIYPTIFLLVLETMKNWWNGTHPSCPWPDNGHAYTDNIFSPSLWELQRENHMVALWNRKHQVTAYCRSQYRGMLTLSCLGTYACIILIKERRSVKTRDFS